ncbi:DinB family protein [Amycolatopsis acidicola]|uniref:DinB family protein n=1 Tax=Amycolatopsis acidicola TaxID=2596893 RepID=A0A5N0V5Z9_9PSEU|nr:DinB family protein [Amycolatopsis acidicola]KAA9159942.1 DinB family protein [Amycolatopsis acidicola]
MASAGEDILDLFDYAWQRFRNRMAGLTDEEWRWQPIADDRVTLRWRLGHIADLLRMERNAPLLGLSEEPGQWPEPRSAEEAMAQTEEAYGRWRANLASLSEDDQAKLLGDAAGYYATSTRRAFALHIVDELIHHTAEAALLRDLYAGR